MSKKINTIVKESNTTPAVKESNTTPVVKESNTTPVVKESNTTPVVKEFDIKLSNNAFDSIEKISEYSVFTNFSKTVDIVGITILDLKHPFCKSIGINSPGIWKVQKVGKRYKTELLHCGNFNHPIPKINAISE